MVGREGIDGPPWEFMEERIYGPPWEWSSKISECFKRRPNLISLTFSPPANESGCCYRIEKQTFSLSSFESQNMDMSFTMEQSFFVDFIWYILILPPSHVCTLHAYLVSLVLLNVFTIIFYRTVYTYNVLSSCIFNLYFRVSPFYYYKIITIHCYTTFFFSFLYFLHIFIFFAFSFLNF